MKWIFPAILAVALLVGVQLQWAADNRAAKPTNNFDAELISTNREPVKLQSARPDWATLPTNATAFTARLPVYVIPEMLVTVLPDGTRLMFIEQHHLAELAKKFRTVRYTNLVIYADGI